MADILDWLRQYPPEDRDGGTLRNAELLLNQRLQVIEKDYADHAHHEPSMAALREAFEADRLAIVDMLARVRAALVRAAT
jgi:hypothetical protein